MGKTMFLKWCLEQEGNHRRDISSVPSLLADSPPLISIESRSQGIEVFQPLSGMEVCTPQPHLRAVSPAVLEEEVSLFPYEALDLSLFHRFVTLSLSPL